jgi:hypothetical protein
MNSVNLLQLFTSLSLQDIDVANRALSCSNSFINTHDLLAKAQSYLHESYSLQTQFQNGEVEQYETNSNQHLKTIAMLENKLQTSQSTLQKERTKHEVLQSKIQTLDSVQKNETLQRKQKEAMLRSQLGSAQVALHKERSEHQNTKRMLESFQNGKAAVVTKKHLEQELLTSQLLVQSVLAQFDKEKELHQSTHKALQMEKEKNSSSLFVGEDKEERMKKQISELNGQIKQMKLEHKKQLDVLSLKESKAQQSLLAVKQSMLEKTTEQSTRNNKLKSVKDELKSEIANSQQLQVGFVELKNELDHVKSFAEAARDELKEIRQKLHNSNTANSKLRNLLNKQLSGGSSSTTTLVPFSMDSSLCWPMNSQLKPLPSNEKSFASFSLEPDLKEPNNHENASKQATLEFSRAITDALDQNKTGKEIMDSFIKISSASQQYLCNTAKSYGVTV